MTSHFMGRYCFVAGLHRSGTSLLHGLIAQHEKISSIENSPAPENEGCYLQGAIPHTAMHGRPGHYATDPAQHLVEECRFDNLATQQRLASDWDKWFQRGGSWRVEKSPVNLTRMRLYQQLFPMSQFVVILRHPSMVAAAHAKWVDASHSELVDYTLDAYEQFVGDLPYLHCVLVIRYEDLVQHAADHLCAIDTFCGLEPQPRETDLRNGNSRYGDAQAMDARQEERADRWGYSGNSDCAHWSPIVAHPLRTVREKCAELITGKIKQ